VSFVPVRGQTASQPFKVEKGVIQVSARVVSTANPVAVVLIDPKGKRYGSSIALPVLGDTVTASAPVDSTTDGQDWQVTVRGVGSLSGVALDPVGVTDGVGAPETFDVVISTLSSGGYTGLGTAVATHPLKPSIEAAISRRLMDSRGADNFAPDAALTRAELAQYLVMGANIRQHLPFTATTQSAADVPPSSALYPTVESVLASGGVLRDLTHRSPSVMSLKFVDGKRVFQAQGTVSRLDLAQSLVKALGPAAVAAAQRHSGAVSYTPPGATAPVMVSDVAALTNVDRGYVQQAIANGIIVPVMENGTWLFKPADSVTRAQYALHAVAFSNQYRTGEDGL
jgi:serine protease AprX